MFNFQSLLTMASQAMLNKLVSSDAMFTQWQNFCAKMGIPSTSRAEFDNLISQFNSTSADSKMSQLQSGMNSQMIQKFLGNFMK